MSEKKNSLRASKDGSKYHFSCRCLPHDFQCKPSDNKTITQSETFPFAIGEFGIQPKHEFLGNDKRKKRGGHNFDIGEVYIIHAIGTSLFKIGMTTNFNKRFSGITGSSPLPLNVFKYGKCDNPHILENHLHELFKDRKFKNEWFHLTKDDCEMIDDIWDKYFEGIPSK